LAQFESVIHTVIIGWPKPCLFAKICHCFYWNIMAKTSKKIF